MDALLAVKVSEIILKVKLVHRGAEGAGVLVIHATEFFNTTVTNAMLAAEGADRGALRETQAAAVSIASTIFTNRF